MKPFVAVVLLAGCDSLWGITRLAPALDVPDAATRDVGVTSCEPQIIHDDFTGTMLCDGWGTPSGISATEGGGMLVIAPEPGVGGSQGGCFSAAPVAFGDEGVFIKVVGVPTEMGDGSGGTYMFFSVHDPAPSDAVTLDLKIGDHQIAASVGMTTVGTVPYDPSQAMWWRIRPDRALPGIAGDISPDGITWQTVGLAAGTIPTSLILEFTAGEYGAGIADPGTAIIEDFNVCP